jgi:DNA polymerase elongation subunit (family B)
MKILLVDIETAPHLAHVWALWDQNVGLSQIIESGYTLCWAAKWLGEREMHFASVRDGKKKMVAKLHKLMSEADAVCTYNGNKFDIPTINKDFLLQGLAPPPPSKSIDLLRVVKSRFRFPSNKLAYVSKALDLGGKVKHSGHELWVKCMAEDDAAWRLMERYNKQDVKLLESLYQRLKPWIKQHPNHSLHADDPHVCPKCGSDTFQRRGVEHTASCTYQRFQCLKCSGWFRSTRNIGPRAGKKYANL